MNQVAMGPGTMMRSRREHFLRLLAVAMMAAMAGGRGRTQTRAGAQAAPQAESQDGPAGATNESGAGAPKDDCAGLRVIQGRITAIEGNVLTVKTPDSFPGGGPGMHAQFVMRGPEMRVDISAGRVLHPDGKQEDKQPMAVGERVVVVFRETAGAGAETESAVRPAAIVERVSTSDRVTTH
jgi:hypothetical protein